MKPVFATILVLATIAGCVRVVDGASRAQQVPYRVAPVETVQGELGDLLNEERRAHGLDNVSYNPRLTRIALAHARDMARRDYFSHRGADGSTPHRRIRRGGYGACLSAENIAKGQDSAAEVMKDWMASPGHRTNNLRPQVYEYGVAHVPEGDYWVLLLASPGC